MYEYLEGQLSVVGEPRPGEIMEKISLTAYSGGELPRALLPCDMDIN